MIGTNDDAIAVSTMLNTQPELGYEVRGVIGELPAPCGMGEPLQRTHSH